MTAELPAPSSAGRLAGDAEQELNVPAAVLHRFGTCAIIAPVSLHSPFWSRHVLGHFHGFFYPSGHSSGQPRLNFRTVPSQWHNHSHGFTPLESSPSIRRFRPGVPVREMTVPDETGTVVWKSVSAHVGVVSFTLQAEKRAPHHQEMLPPLQTTPRNLRNPFQL